MSQTVSMTQKPRRTMDEQSSEFPDANRLEKATGIKASTWRYWAHIGFGPPSFKLGRRRVWRWADVLAWIADQEATTGGAR
jgi:predicted DNA-binding transcriptional regulator AlpA